MDHGPARRPPHPIPPLDGPPRLLHERERDRQGGLHPVTTVFLVGATCPFDCVFCDLWQHTIPGPTPPGAITAQLDRALPAIPHDAWIKLYNASNFFDDHAVPSAEDAGLVARLRRFDRVVVECHPRLIGDRCFGFAERLEGRLEVAVGLETVHPDAVERLGKRMTIADFDAAAGALRDRAIGLRAFVLLGAPFVPAGAQRVWTLRSVRHAVGAGATTVSIIPLRRGAPRLDTLAAAGAWRPVTLDDLEAVLQAALEETGAVVQGDLWDLDRLAVCPVCLPDRRARLTEMNLLGRPVDPVGCRRCGGVRAP